MYKVYIIQSQKNGRYYIGMTSDVYARLEYHNRGKNKSTKYGRPWKIIYYEDCEDKKSAWLRERQIKRYKNGEAFKKLVRS